MTIVRTRIAPSPTGDDMHIGNLRTALLNYVFAKKNNGQFIVRFEDTDQQRKVEGGGEQILQSLKDYGIVYDEGPDRDGRYGPYTQSERLDTYKRYALELVEKGVAYYCTCSKDRLVHLREDQQKAKKVPRYDKHCLTRQDEVKKLIEEGEQYVIRLNVLADIDIIFHDAIRGNITISSNEVDDQVLVKSDGFPTYHLAVVIDDHFMQITHVIRGEEWISSTPKHVLLYQAFGWDLPIYAHMALLRNPDKSKLSKRKNPVWAHWYLQEGYLPQAVLNYLSLMAWTHPEQKEIFDIEELVRVFELEHMQAGSPIFDVVKLGWMNGEYIRQLTIENVQLKIADYYQKYRVEQWEIMSKKSDLFAASLPLVRERMKKLSEYWELCRFLFEAPIEYEVDLAPHKALLGAIHAGLETITDWSAVAIGQLLQDVAIREGVKNKEFFQIVRVAITGRKISPPLNESMEILGKDECLSRLGSFA